MIKRIDTKSGKTISYVYNLKDEDYRIVSERLEMSEDKIKNVIDEEMDTYCCGILILDKWRNRGYGTEGIKLLCRSAKENGIKEFYDNIAIDNPSVNQFKKLGFIEKFRNEEYVRMYKKL